MALAAFAVASFSATSNAQFTELFDALNLGALEGQLASDGSGATWEGWGGGNSFISQVVNDPVTGAPDQCVLLPWGTDTVADFDNITGGNPFMSGQWTMTADSYVPGTFDGRTYYIAMNTYDWAAGSYEWAIQVALDASAGLVNCDCGTAGTQVATLLFDQWVPMRWEIDIDGDWVDFYYNDVLVAGYEWSKGVFGGDNYTTLSINALDLYPDLPTTTTEDVFFDDIKILPNSVTPPGTAYCPGDGSGTQCPCANNSAGPGGCDWGNASFPEGGVLDATGSDSIAANDTILMATGIENNFGIFFGANNAVNGGAGNPLNDGLRCAGGGLVRLISPTMASGNQMMLPAPAQTLDTGAAAGVTRRYQYWFRTPAGPCGTSANLTNGYEIVWMP